MAVTAGRGHAYACVAVVQRLAAAYVGVGGVHFEIHESQGGQGDGLKHAPACCRRGSVPGAVPGVPGNPGLLLQGGPFPREVILVQPEKTRHVRIDHGDFVGQFRTPAPVPLLQAQAVDRVQPEIGQAEGRARLLQGIVQLHQVFHRRVQFPAQFAHVVHPERPHGPARNADLLAAQPAECATVQGRVREPDQDIPRGRPGQHQHAPLIGDVGDLHLFAGMPALDQVIQVAQFGAGRGQYVEMIIGQVCDRHLGPDPPAFGQQVRQHDAAGIRHPVGADTVQEGAGAGAGHVVLGKTR